MPRKSKVPPLVGKAEAAEIIGVHPNNMVKRGVPMQGLPEPLQEELPEDIQVRATPVWRRTDIEAFAERRRQADTAAK